MTDWTHETPGSKTQLILVHGLLWGSAQVEHTKRQGTKVELNVLPGLL